MGLGPSVNICNKALSMFGQKTISNLDEQSEETRKCKLFYNDVRKAVLRGANWNFARKRARLNKVELNENDLSKFHFNYALPPKCLYVRSIYVNGVWVEFEKFIRKELFSDSQGRKLLSVNIDEALIEYTADIEDSDLYDSEFEWAFVLTLSDVLCYPLSGKMDKGAELFQRAQMAIDKAAASTLNEENNYVRQESSYLKDYE
ncbi:MAG: hypothetical protein LBD46_08490 [Endomicrobium sp.]|jgi:uncharacterized protein YjbI with pentapeptide repeats|nr:hypothetical protein [Endomicrobium sp.]